MAQYFDYPLICTRGAVLFPFQDLAVEVGREQSIKAVNYTLNNSLDIVLLSQKDLTVDNPNEEDLYSYGTLCRIKSSRVRDNHLKVIFVGLQRCRVVKFYLQDEINHVEVELLNDEIGDELKIEVLCKKALLEFNFIAQKYGRPGFPIGNANVFDSTVASSLVDTFAQVYVQGINEKEMYLEELSIIKRLNMMLEYVTREKKKDEIDIEINKKVKDLIDNNQKDFYLREKLKAIKDELGDSATSDIDKYKERLENNPYPENIVSKVNEEIKRFEMTPASSGESPMIMSYIELLLDLPWWQKTEDEKELNHVSDILNEDHYGLEKVKERILEYLAVKEMTNSLKSPIICLVGPPGVGKTSLAKSVARALNRKFVKISLGGVRDEAEIRGHRRTYLGSMAGRIIQGMRKAGTTNPVFLIDEIDKMSSDYKGDPSSAMLEVLDPEQNSFFSDHYLEEPYDLSDVLFIATANYIENIPAPLQDRLEIIDLSSYTEYEKMMICKNHLIPKELKANGLNDKQFSLDDDIILYLIRHYTREAGVRQLERVVASLCRKTVLEILKNNKHNVKINKKLVKLWLGNEKYDFGSKEKKDQVGVVTGLAYTAFGGDILQIEVNYFEGKGKLIITGQLGDVMKESAEIALDYIKANAKKYHIDIKFFETHDIHIHVPEGAVPKDGPSAGVTLTTALVSAITNTPVHANLAMTGEVTLRGNVLPIGGLKEKSLAANRSGIKKILIPKGNVKNLDDVPDAIKESITFVPCEKVETVLKEALVK